MRRAANRQDHTPIVSVTQKPGCNGKRQYASFGVAERMAKRTRRQWHTKVSAYKCRACGSYHVGEPAHPTVGRK